MITIEEIIILIYEYQAKHYTDPVCVIIHPDNLKYIIQELELQYHFYNTNNSEPYRIMGIRIYRSLDVEIGAVVVS